MWLLSKQTTPGVMQVKSILFYSLIYTLIGCDHHTQVSTCLGPTHVYLRVSYHNGFLGNNTFEPLGHQPYLCSPTHQQQQSAGAEVRQNNCIYTKVKGLNIQELKFSLVLF